MFQPLQTIPKEKLKDNLQRQIAEQTKLPLPLVETVLSFSFSEIRQAFHQHSEIEISGFGIFRVVPTRLRARLRLIKVRHQRTQAKLQDPNLSERQRRNLLIRQELQEETLAFLQKLNDELTKQLS